MALRRTDKHITIKLNVQLLQYNSSTTSLVCGLRNSNITTILQNAHCIFCIIHTHTHTYRVAQKMAPFLYALTSSNINQFSKFFHCQNREKICNNILTKDPTTPQVCHYTTL